MSMTTTGGGGGSLVPHDMNSAMQLARMMATSKLVPVHLQKSEGDCLLVIEQAMRWNMSPFAVAQCTSVIQGRLNFEGKLVAAAVQTSGVLAGRLKYTFAGEGNTRSITVAGEIKGEIGAPRDITVRLADAKTTNQMWIKQPDQQLVYFGTRAWARRHTPEVMLGVYSPEEWDEPKRDNFTGTTIEATQDSHVVAKMMDNYDRGVAANPLKGELPPETIKPLTADEKIQRWLTKLALELSAATTSEEIDGILARDDVQRAQDKLRGDHKDRLQDLLDEAVRRAQSLETSAPNGDEPPAGLFGDLSVAADAP